MLGIKVLAWDMYKNVARLKRLMGSQPSLLDNWISNDNTYINKRLKNRHRFDFTYYYAYILVRNLYSLNCCRCLNSLNNSNNIFC